jgi:hypothetical protein
VLLKEGKERRRDYKLTLLAYFSLAYLIIYLLF